MQVYLVQDHDGFVVTAFASRDLAQGYIDRLEADTPAWQRAAYGWRVQEMLVLEEIPDA